MLERQALMIKATIRYVDYLDDLPPSSPGPFMVGAEAGIGNESGTDIFQVMICNAEWIAQQAETASALWPRGCLVVRSLEPDHVKSVLEALVANFAGSKDWETFAERLNRYLLWEFEDLDDSQGEPAIPQLREN